MRLLPGDNQLGDWLRVAANTGLLLELLCRARMERARWLRTRAACWRRRTTALRGITDAVLFVLHVHMLPVDDVLPAGWNPCSSAHVGNSGMTSLGRAPPASTVSAVLFRLDIAASDDSPPPPCAATCMMLFRR